LKSFIHEWKKALELSSYPAILEVNVMSADDGLHRMGMGTQTITGRALRHRSAGMTV